MTAVGMAALVLSLTGCGGGDPMPTLPPTPSATPIFASEEEALDAAEEAYAAYLEMSNLISSEGGVDPERIAPFVAPERLDDELRGFAVVRDNELRIVGETLFEVVEVQRVDVSEADVDVVIYVCWDASASIVLDATGSDVTPPDRATRALLEVHIGTVGGRLPLVLIGDEQWQDTSC